MKKIILTFALLATLSTTFVSCSTDDSELQTTKQADSIPSDGVLIPPSKPTK